MYICAHWQGIEEAHVSYDDVSREETMFDISISDILSSTHTVRPQTFQFFSSWRCALNILSHDYTENFANFLVSISANSNNNIIFPFCQLQFLSINDVIKFLHVLVCYDHHHQVWVARPWSELILNILKLFRLQ